MSDAWQDHQAEARARQERTMGAYGRLFSGQGSANDAAVVLEDLRAFCHVDRDMFSPEAPTLMANLLGRYRVWQRIEGLRRGDEAGFNPTGYVPPETAQRFRSRHPLPPTGEGPVVQEE